MKKKKKGSSLAYVLLITASVMVVGTTCLTMLTMGLKTTIQENKRMQSLYGADAGIDWAQSLLMGTFQTATEYAEQRVKEMYEYDFDTTKMEELNDLFKQAFRDYIETNNTKKEDFVNEFVQSLKDKQYYDMPDKKSIKKVCFSNSAANENNQEAKCSENAPEFEIKPLEIKDMNTYQIEVSSTFESVTSEMKNEREISVVFEIKVPDFKGQYLDESVEIYPVFNDKTMAIDGDLDISDSNVSVSGDIFVVGNEVDEIKKPTYDKYKGGITLTNSTLTSTDNIVTANTMNLISSSTVEGKSVSDSTSEGVEKEPVYKKPSLYARNLYLGSTEVTGTIAYQTESKPNIEVVLDEVIVDNDLAINATNSNVTINKFYGINDKTYEELKVNAETADINKTSKTSSSIIVNQEDSTLTIKDEAYIMGVAYIDTQGEKYETGESIAVKGNYIAYTQPLVGTKFEEAQFNYYEPLYLVDQMNDEDLTVVQKNDYFYEFAKKQAENIRNDEDNNPVILNEANSILKSGGITLPDSSKVHTVGAIVYIKDNNLIVERANIPTGDEVIKKQVIYADMVYNMGDIYNEQNNKDTALYNLDDPDKQLTVQKSINFTTLENNCKSSDLDCGDIDDVIIETSEEKTLNLGSNRGKDGFTGIILSNSDIVIDGDFELNGILMTTGTVTIKNSNTKNKDTDLTPGIKLNYDKNVVQKILSKNYELFDGVFQGKVIEKGDVSGFLEYDSKNYNPTKFIKTTNWKLVR